MVQKRKKTGEKQIYWAKKDAGTGRPGGGLEANLVETNLQSPLALAWRWSNIYIISSHTPYLGTKKTCKPLVHSPFMSTMAILVKFATKYLQNNQKYLQQKSNICISAQKVKQCLNFKLQSHTYIWSCQYYVCGRMFLFSILCSLQNMGLKETQEFPSPEQFVRNNYGKWKNLYFDILSSISSLPSSSCSWLCS